MPNLFDPAAMDELKGVGDTSAIMMMLQGHADIIKDADSFLIEEENLLGEEPLEMSQIAQEQKLAIQKGKVR